MPTLLVKMLLAVLPVWASIAEAQRRPEAPLGHAPTAAPAKPQPTGPRVSAPTASRDTNFLPARPKRTISKPYGTAASKPHVAVRRNALYRDPKLAPQRTVPGAYPWHFDITATVFWIGERPTARNPVPNDRSSWDTAWMRNFGGFDNPDPAYRTADYCPLAFRPKQNPFYVALPYNDCVNSREHKPEAARVIPWFEREFTAPGKSVCKGKWVQIFHDGAYCFAQWEDCGPFTTDDWAYVFGNKPPMNRANKRAGIDISPAVRDYLGIERGTATVHWRFVDFHRVPGGPWCRYGDNNPFVNPEARPKSAVQRPKPRTDRRYTRDDLHGP